MFSSGCVPVLYNHVSIQSTPQPPLTTRYTDEPPPPLLLEASIVENNFSCGLHHKRAYRAVLPLQVKRTYSQGTYRAGAMRQVSLVGAVDEEVGDYFPEFISMLQESPFLEVSGSHSSACVRLCVFVCTYKHRGSRPWCERPPSF